MKKPSAKDRRAEQESAFAYHERVPVDREQISTRVLNALQHLGDQRFALPPFSEHFERWMKDVSTIVTEVETELPEMVDQTYKDESGRILGDAKLALRGRIEAEKSNSEEIAKVQSDLSSCELELSKLEHEYKTRTREARKMHERSLGKIKGEIDSLDKERQKLLRKKTSIIDRILRKPTTKLEESTRALQTKRNDIGSSQTTLKQELADLRANYEVARHHVIERQETLRTKLAELKANTPNDALELRSKACQELLRVITGALGRLPQPDVSSETPNIQ